MRENLNNPHSEWLSLNYLSFAVECAEWPQFFFTCPFLAEEPFSYFLSFPFQDAL